MLVDHMMSGDAHIPLQVVDASQSVTDVHQQLLQLSLSVINSTLTMPIKLLWNST